MHYYDLTEFLRLSAVLNYQLSAKNINWNNIVTIILGKKGIPDQERDVLLLVVDYLGKVYGQKKRRLGSLAILHPLRATALLSRSSEGIHLLDLLTELLHDFFEDIKPEEFKNLNWLKLDTAFRKFVSTIPSADQWFLMERLQWLTKGPAETYYRYIGRLLNQAQNTPEVVRVKLADRLDNTLDMRIDLEDPLQGVDFFENIFQMLFSKTYKGYKPEMPHFSPSAVNGAQRLYQLSKNIVLMSLVRQKDACKNDPIAQEIFKNLATAGIKEAQRIALHIFGYHETAIDKMRELMIETMIYVQKGGIDTVTFPTKGARLDGLFMSRFDDPNKRNLKRKLAVLYKDKPLMVEAAIAFIVIFLNFLNDPNYYVHGISEDGIHPEAQ